MLSNERIFSGNRSLKMMCEGRRTSNGVGSVGNDGQQTDRQVLPGAKEVTKDSALGEDISKWFFLETLRPLTIRAGLESDS
jgi:hypothetical protein